MKPPRHHRRAVRWLFIAWVVAMLGLCAFLGSQRRIVLSPSMVSETSATVVSE